MEGWSHRNNFCMTKQTSSLGFCWAVQQGAGGTGHRGSWVSIIPERPSVGRGEPEETWPGSGPVEGCAGVGCSQEAEAIRQEMISQAIVSQQLSTDL